MKSLTDQTKLDSQHDLEHFLKLALAQVRHRLKTCRSDSGSAFGSAPGSIFALQLLEDLIQEQGQINENSRTSVGPTR